MGTDGRIVHGLQQKCEFLARAGYGSSAIAWGGPGVPGPWLCQGIGSLGSLTGILMPSMHTVNLGSLINSPQHYHAVNGGLTEL